METRLQILLDLEQAVVNGVWWVLGIELGSSASALCALDSFCSVLFLELCHMELGNRTFDESC